MRLNLAQLQVIVNDLHSYIECEYISTSLSMKIYKYTFFFFFRLKRKPCEFITRKR